MPVSSRADASPSEAGPCSTAPIPSYKKEIVPILNSRCNGCHTGGGGPWPLATHQDVVDWRTNIITDLEKGTMPPADAGATFLPGERSLLLTWLRCGAPAN